MKIINDLAKKEIHIETRADVNIPLENLINFKTNKDTKTSKSVKKKSKQPKKINNKKFRHKLKRKERKKKGGFDKIPSQFQISQIAPKSYSSLIRFLNKKIPKEILPNKKIVIPKELSFVSNFELTIKFFKDLHNSLYKTNHDIVLDFEKCISLNVGTATYLKIMLDEYYFFRKKYNDSNYSNIVKEVTVERSKTTKTNKMLYALRIGNVFDNDDDDELRDSSYLPLGLKTISKLRSGYKENKKGKICKEVNSFINGSLEGIGIEFDPIGRKLIDNLLSEILGNAEDHSILSNYYVNGVSFKEDKDKSYIEFNLVIMNFGFSIYEGFQETKEKNVDVIEMMDRYYNNYMELLNGIHDKNYTKESLYTLLALQQGISRIKYKDKSRGNGTMNFIKAFMELGQYGVEGEKFESKLNVISGHTVIECSKKYRPYKVKDSDIFHLSLNHERDLKKLPCRSSIFTKEEYFPGTILQAKIYMSEEYFLKLIEENEKQNKN